MRIGPDYYSNRWLDWRIRDGRLESVEGSTTKSMGGGHVDYCISTRIHHWHGEDGGLIVAVDGTGKIVVRDDSQLEGPMGPRADHAPVPTEPSPAYGRGRSGT